MRGAPKPPNFSSMVDAWENPAEFASLVNAYYSMLAAESASETRDITSPLHEREETI